MVFKTTLSIFKYYYNYSKKSNLMIENSLAMGYHKINKNERRVMQ